MKFILTQRLSVPFLICLLLPIKCDIFGSPKKIFRSAPVVRIPQGFIGPRLLMLRGHSGQKTELWGNAASLKKIFSMSWNDSQDQHVLSSSFIHYEPGSFKSLEAINSILRRHEGQYDTVAFATHANPTRLNIDLNGFTIDAKGISKLRFPSNACVIFLGCGVGARHWPIPALPGLPKPGSPVEARSLLEAAVEDAGAKMAVGFQRGTTYVDDRSVLIHLVRSGEPVDFTKTPWFLTPGDNGIPALRAVRRIVDEIR